MSPALPPVYLETDDCICNVTGRSPGPAAMPSLPCWSLSPASISQNEPFYPHTDSCQVLCCSKKKSDSYSKSSLACLSLLSISFSWFQAENHTFQPRAFTGVFTQMVHEYQGTILRALGPVGQLLKATLIEQGASRVLTCLLLVYGNSTT